MRGNIGVEFDHMNVETQRYIKSSEGIHISEVVIFTLFISTRTLPKIPKESTNRRSSVLLPRVSYKLILHSSDKTRDNYQLVGKTNWSKVLYRKEKLSISQ